MYFHRKQICPVNDNQMTRSIQIFENISIAAVHKSHHKKWEIAGIYLYECGSNKIGIRFHVEYLTDIHSTFLAKWFLSLLEIVRLGLLRWELSPLPYINFSCIHVWWLYTINFLYTRMMSIYKKKSPFSFCPLIFISEE